MTDAHRAARRAVARRLHPDVGGNQDDYIAALAEVERTFARQSPTTAFVRTRRARVVKRLRLVHTRFRRRHYFDL